MDYTNLILESKAELAGIMSRNELRGWIMLGLMGAALIAYLWAAWMHRRARKELLKELEEARQRAEMLEDEAESIAAACPQAVEYRDGTVWYRMM